MRLYTCNITIKTSVCYEVFLIQLKNVVIFTIVMSQQQRQTAASTKAATAATTKAATAASTKAATAASTKSATAATTKAATAATIKAATAATTRFQVCVSNRKHEPLSTLYIYTKFLLSIKGGSFCR